jgi:hypothetical protein
MYGALKELGKMKTRIDGTLAAAGCASDGGKPELNQLGKSEPSRTAAMGSCGAAQRTPPVQPGRAPVHYNPTARPDVGSEHRKCAEQPDCAGPPDARCSPPCDQCETVCAEQPALRGTARRTAARDLSSEGRAAVK